jgi:hypothetical protein
MCTDSGARRLQHVTAVLALALDCEALPEVKLQALGFLRKLAETPEGLAEAGEDGVIPRAIRLLTASPNRAASDHAEAISRGSRGSSAASDIGFESSEIRGGIRVAALGLLNVLGVNPLLRQMMMMEGGLQAVGSPWTRPLSRSSLHVSFPHIAPLPCVSQMCVRVCAGARGRVNVCTCACNACGRPRFPPLYGCERTMHADIHRRGKRRLFVPL